MNDPSSPPRALYLSAAHKSSGKTTLALGICAALRQRGLAVQPYKKGPDYIDPMWLGQAAGRGCRNLDFRTQGVDEIEADFATHIRGADFALVEGNKGLFDGMDLEGSDCNAALARLLRLPVLLVVDCGGITRGVAPLLLGYQAFDPALQFAGVILNKVAGPRHESKLRAVIERFTDFPVLGAVTRDERLQIEERHLGLVPSSEAQASRTQIDRIAEMVAAQVDLERVIEAGRPIESKPDLGSTTSARPFTLTSHSAPAARPAPTEANPPTSVRIAIPRDRAFGFYYPGDLEALRAAGAELIFFDTLHDDEPPTMDGLFIGGGFPEVWMAELEANRALRRRLAELIESGLPSYAECGGLMYLARAIRWQGERREMVGVLPGEAVMHERPQGRGYVRLMEEASFPWPALEEAAGEGVETPVEAHEFHHSSLEGLGSDLRFAYRVMRGQGIDGQHDGLIYRNLLASYAHLRHTGRHPWAARFVAFVRQQRLDP